MWRRLKHWKHRNGKERQIWESRLNAKERESEQKTVILLSGIMFLIGFVLCGLNYRFFWIVLPQMDYRRGDNPFSDCL